MRQTPWPDDERHLKYCERSASTALVTPQNWLFLGGYQKLRQRLLEEALWDCVARLGAGAFEPIGGEIANVSLVSLSGRLPAKEHCFARIDVSEEKAPSQKDESLTNHALTRLSHVGNPPHLRVTVTWARILR